MAKYSGMIGFKETPVEDPPDSGLWPQKVTEVKFTGDVKKLSRKFEPGESVSDDVSVSTIIEVIATPYAKHNIGSILYATWLGQKWKVVTVDVAYPRIKLRLGSLYNGG